MMMKTDFLSWVEVEMQVILLLEQLVAQLSFPFRRKDSKTIDLLILSYLNLHTWLKNGRRQR